MAQGDVVFFDYFLLNMALGPDVGHDFGVSPNEIKCAIIDSVLTPTETTVDPTWGAAGTTDFSLREVTATPAYIAGGNVCATASVALSGGLVEFDWGDPSPWAADAGGDTDAKWGIIYDNTTADKNCIGFVDLGPAFDMSSGTLTISWGTPVATLNQAP